MSWLKRRGQTTSPNPNPSSAPPVHMYNPNQHSSLQSQWQQQDLQPPSNTWYTQTQTTQQNVNPTNYSKPPQEPNYWSHSHNQQTSNTYNPNPTSQYSEQYPQNNPAVYTNENNSYQPRNYSNQPAHNPLYNYSEPSNHIEPKSNADSWNWGWGDEDNSNHQNVPQSQTNSNVNTNIPPSSNEETWNWSIDDNNTVLSSPVSSSKNITDTRVNSSSTTQFNPPPQNLQNVVGSQPNMFPQMGKLAEKHSQDNNKYSEDGTLEGNINRSSPYTDSINQAVMTPTLKYSKTDHLTPQWSTESQMSQDSSDILHTSESDKSHMLSRSSTISESPVSGHDINSENVLLRQEMQNNQQQELYNTQTLTETSVADNITPNFYQQDVYNLQQENKEDISDLKQFKNNSTPPPPLKNQTPPLGPPIGDQNLNNPYKLNSGLSHKSTNKYNTESKLPVHYSLNQPKYPVPQSHFNQSVNLESLPDNSEQPDTVPHTYKKASVKHAKKATLTPVLAQQWGGNYEAAPINDRNQYLETGQLSNNEFNQSPTNALIDTSDTLPPPGFTRMVLGQMEQTDHLGNQEEPPPGLSRMVLGETSSSSTLAQTDHSEPLHRMIPGGSSSPNVISRYQTTTYQQPTYGDGNISESELIAPIGNQIRSATIGADIPPTTTNLAVGSSVVNRSKTIGADITLPYSSATSENIKSSNNILSASNSFNNNIRETNVDGANNLDETIAQPVTTRRDSIEGEPQDSSLSNLVNAIRDLSVGENQSANSALAVTERTPRRLSKQESTDSDCEHEGGHISRDRRDRRYYDKHNDYDREKARSRYSPSPDRYRDKKYERMRYRDRRYDDDTDYYSDKEREKKTDDKDRQEELDRKYSSLKRDKEKERRRKEHRSQRDYGREGHRKEYYHRYEDEYDDPSKSRPSSRSDSLHDSYRQDRNRHRDRERDRYRGHRDPYMPYMQGYSYDPYNPYYQQYQYQYFQNLRRTNPQAYAEWYRKYYQQGNSQQGYGNEDRASVHSGRSSANDELNKDRPFDQTDSSLYLEETTASQRLTPAKFATAHIKASITSGRLIKIFPHYPLDGQPATVEVTNLQDILSNDDEYKELNEFPGPLIKGVTHKKTIIEYCENKIRNAIYSNEIIDADSYILMWELLILLLRQNGMVVGTDIAELLMKDRKQENSRKASVTSNNSSGVVEPAADAIHPLTSDVHSSSTSILKEEVVTNKFRDYLLYGSEKEALEWAMKHGLWGHALFLASKLDKRTYANVMTRFANGLTMNDPLQTLYQLLSGKVPAAVTCVSDEKWGDWRPHLAMILSNTTQRPELDRKAITTLGDTLLNRNSLYAAQFCYLMAQVGFNRYGTETAKLVLLGSNHNKPFVEFAINEAIYMTEVYEYACSLNDVNFVIPEFLPYKYLLATRLADRGLLEQSLAYLEKIALAILQNPSIAQPTLIHQVSVLADRLKYCDPVEDSFEGDVELHDNRPDNSWLKELKAIEKNYNMALSVQETIENIGNNVEIDQNEIGQTPYEQPSWSQPYVDEQQWQTMQYDQHNNLDYHQTQNIEGYSTSEQYQDQQPYWSNKQVENVEQIGVDATSQPLHTTEIQSQNNYWSSAPAQDTHRPQISMPNQSNEHIAFKEQHKEEISTQRTNKDSPNKHKPQDKPATTGWFGGIWNKLSLRPKNQMKLPDDKNPTIVWDEQKKTWVNLDSDGDTATTELKPPPKMADMYPVATQQQNSMPNIPTQQDVAFHNTANLLGNYNEPTGTIHNHGMVSNHTPINNNIIHDNMQKRHQVEQSSTSDNPLDQLKNSQPNMFKLQRGRNIRKSYVDVFNPGAKNLGSTAPIPAPDAFSSLPSNGVQMNYFVPAAITDPNAPTDFLTPAPIHDDNSQH